MDRDRYVDSPEVLERFHAHLELVDIIAGQLMRTLQGPLQLDDLLSAGREGLLEAARRYDASRGVPFRAFANYRIKGAMVDQIRQMTPLSRRVHQRLLAAETATLLNEGYAEYALSEPAADLDESEAEETIEAHVDAVVLGAALRVKVASTRADVAPSTVPDPETVYQQVEILRILHRELEGLDQDEAHVVKRHYFEEHRLEDIAADLKVSKSWASRLHTKALRRLTACIHPPKEPDEVS